jgi:hypothetical protein
VHRGDDEFGLKLAGDNEAATASDGDNCGGDFRIHFEFIVHSLLILAFRYVDLE